MAKGRPIPLEVRLLMARPLTKRRPDGTLYVRPPTVEKQVDLALTLAPNTLLERAYVEDGSKPEYLSCECLVHLIREANRRKDEDLRNKLLTPLLIRCERILLMKLPDGSRPSAAELRDEILGQFGELIALDGSNEDQLALDYYECRFNHAFRTLRLDLLRSERQYSKGRIELPSNGEEDAGSLDDKSMACLSRALSTPATQEESLFKQELSEAIDALPTNERRAVALHFLHGYEVESVDPRRATVATICGVSGRTIRNRLARACATLAEVFQEEP